MATTSARPVATEPCQWVARALWGETLVAHSARAIRIEVSGSTPLLAFPRDDVRFEVLHDTGRTAHDELGGAQYWSIDAAAGASDGAPDDWHGGDRVPTTGDGIARMLTEPAPPLAVLTDHVVFDHDRVRVELVDARPSDEEADVTVKRFPTWGDAAHLVDLLDVRADGDRTYMSVARADERRPVVEASQMLGQAIVAAGRHAPGRRVVSAHMVFVRTADAREPLRFEVDEITAGRTFSSLAIHVSQHDRRCATGTFLLDATAPDGVRHAVAAPACVGPYDSVPYDMGVMGRDIRVVDAAYTNDRDAPVGPPVIDAWVRFRALPDDPPLHAGLLAQFTGHMSIAAALRPHAGVGQLDAHRTLSMGINAIGISFHEDVRADDWMLYHHASTFAGDGMTHAECRVHDSAGALLASFTVDAMVRPFAANAAVDDRTAL